MKKMKASAYAKEYGLSYRTVITHYHAGIIPGEQLPTGTILLHVEEEEQFVPVKGVALYSRVSSSQNKSNLDTQQKRLEDYAAAKGYQIARNVKEVGPGLDEQRPQLLNLLSTQDWDILIVEHKDRLTRFGFTFIEELLHQTGRRIEVINVSEDKDDLMEDFVSVITSFAARIYGKHRSKRKTEQIIQELTHE